MAVPVWQSIQTAVVAINATVTVNKPASVAIGDLLLFHAMANADRTVTTPPTGFTLIRLDSDHNTVSMVSYYRIADGSEASTFSLTWNAAPGSNSGMCHRITGTHQTTPINQNSGQLNVNTTAGTAPSVTTTVNDCLLVYFGGSGTGGQTSTPPSGMTEQSDMARAETATVGFPTAGATGTKVNTWAIASDNGAQLIALAPPPASVAVSVGISAGLSLTGAGPFSFGAIT